MLSLKDFAATTYMKIALESKRFVDQDEGLEDVGIPWHRGS